MNRMRITVVHRLSLWSPCGAATQQWIHCFAHVYFMHLLWKCLSILLVLLHAFSHLPHLSWSLSLCFVVGAVMHSNAVRMSDFRDFNNLFGKGQKLKLWLHFHLPSSIFGWQRFKTPVSDVRAPHQHWKHHKYCREKAYLASMIMCTVTL